MRDFHFDIFNDIDAAAFVVAHTAAFHGMLLRHIIADFYTHRPHCFNLLLALLPAARESLPFSHYLFLFAMPFYRDDIYRFSADGVPASSADTQRGRRPRCRTCRYKDSACRQYICRRLNATEIMPNAHRQLNAAQAGRRSLAAVPAAVRRKYAGSLCFVLFMRHGTFRL